MKGALAAKGATWLRDRIDRRSFLGRAALSGAALSVNPWGYLSTPVSAYAATCNCRGNNCACGSMCCDGYTEFCCTLTGQNSCPPGTILGGWWKADGSRLCGGPRYYLDCNTLPGHSGVCSCGCALGSCSHRMACCSGFRYGQCHQEYPTLGKIMCRVVTCTPPWVLDPACTTTPAVDQYTLYHDAPCLHAPPPKPKPPPPPPPPQEDDMPTVRVRRVIVNPADPTSGYVLDSQGGLHPFGAALAITDAAYWPTVGAAIDAVIVDWTVPSGYTLDVRGGIHAFGGLSSPTNNQYFPTGFLPPKPP